MEMVWKLLAGIEDGFDNGWLLIRADAGSLLFPLRLLCAFALSEPPNHGKEPFIACVPGADFNGPIG